MATSKTPATVTARARGARAESPLTAPHTQRARKILKSACQPPKVPPIVNPPDHPKIQRQETARAKAPRPKTTAAIGARRKSTVSAKTAPSPSRGQRRQARQADEQQQKLKARKRQQQKRQAQRAQRVAQEAQAHLQAQEKLATLPIVHSHAAGIDVGDATHWVCVEQTPDGTPRVREFSAMTHGLREMIAWLRDCGVTTVALEATGIYSHILFLSLLEAGLEVKQVPPQFTRQIQGRPKTDKRDCEWIQRLHKLGLLPATFQPDEATQTLRD